MKKLALILTVVLLIPLYSEELTGRAVMEKVVNKTEWNDMEGEITMKIMVRGRTRTRKIKMYSRKRTEQDSDMVMKFLYPPDIEGTAFLLIEHSKGEDERYLYLPALRRIKRIAASGKGGAFMGSDFSYYDIGKPKLKDWKYRNLGFVKFNSIKCYRIEAVPSGPKIEKDTKYSKIIHWVDPNRWSIVHAEYYDRTATLWKVLYVKEIKKIEDIWFQTDLLMKNVLSGSQSEMEFEAIKINQRISKELFTKRYLVQ